MIEGELIEKELHRRGWDRWSQEGKQQSWMAVVGRRVARVPYRLCDRFIRYTRRMLSDANVWRFIDRHDAQLAASESAGAGGVVGYGSI
jgi:hypothetical protein